MAGKQTLPIKITAIDNTQKAFRAVTRGLNGVRKALFSFKAGITAALGAAGLGLLIKQSMQSIDTLGKTASKLGVTTQELQKLRYAAELAGVQTRTTDMAVQRFTRRLAEAANGTGEAKDALKELGIDAAKLTKLPLEKQMLALADAFDDVESSGDRVRLAFKLFDSEGVAFVNTLQGGRAELQAMFAEVDNLGIALSTRAVKGVDEANDAFTRLFSVVRGVIDTLVSALAPAFTFLADKAREALIDRIGGDFGNVEKFGKEMAVAIIEFLKGMSRAVIEFTNTVIRNMNNVIAMFNDIRRAMSFGISAEEYQASIGKIVSAFEAWREKTMSASDDFQREFLKIEILLDDLRNGAELSSDELMELSKAVKEVGAGGGALGAVAGNLSTLIAEAGRKSKKTTGEMLTLGKVSLDLTGVFDELRAAMNQAPPVIEETGNQAKKATPKVLGLVEAAAQASLQMKEMQRSVFGATVPFHVLQNNIDQTDSFFVAANDNIKATTRSIADLAAEFEKIDAPMQEARESLEKVGMTMDDVKMRGIDRLEDALVGLVTGTKSASQAFKDMARSILADLARIMIQQQITLPLAQSMGFNVAGARAMGGPVTAGRPYLVGEKGPEIVVPGRTSGVIPNGGIGGGGVTVNQTINLTTGVSQTVRAEVLWMLPQIAEAAKGAVLDAKRRGGSYAAAMG